MSESVWIVIMMSVCVFVDCEVMMSDRECKCVDYNLF